MVNRRKKFIGKKIQLGTVFWVTIINVLAFTFIIVSLGFFPYTTDPKRGGGVHPEKNGGN